MDIDHDGVTKRLTLRMTRDRSNATLYAFVVEPQNLLAQSKEPDENARRMVRQHKDHMPNATAKSQGRPSAY